MAWWLQTPWTYAAAAALFPSFLLFFKPSYVSKYMGWSEPKLPQSTIEWCCPSKAIILEKSWCLRLRTCKMFPQSFGSYWYDVDFQWTCSFRVSISASAAQAATLSNCIADYLNVRPINERLSNCHISYVMFLLQIPGGSASAIAATYQEANASQTVAPTANRVCGRIFGTSTATATQGTICCKFSPSDIEILAPNTGYYLFKKNNFSCFIWFCEKANPSGAWWSG